MQKLHLGAAQCALDLGDGSERAEYVNQDYILHKLGRPHRAHRHHVYLLPAR